MRLRRLPPLLALFFPAFMLSAPGHADEIELTNGDRITGRIVSKAGNELVVRTDYAGELRLRWDLVKSLRTSEPVTVMTTGGDLLNSAQLAASEADKVALSNPSTEGNVKRGDIA